MRAGSFLEGKPDPLALLKTKLIEDGRTSSLFASTLPPGFATALLQTFAIGDFALIPPGELIIEITNVEDFFFFYFRNNFFVDMGLL